MTIRTVGSGKNHATIQAAIDWYATNWASQADQEHFVDVYAGTYTESPTTNALTGGTATKFITIRQVTGEAVALRLTGTSYGITLARGYHGMIGFDDMQPDSTFTGFTLVGLNGTGNHIRECKLFNPNRATVSTYAIYKVGGSNVIAEDVCIAGFNDGGSRYGIRGVETVRRCTVAECDYGISDASTDCTDNVVVDCTWSQFSGTNTGDYNAASNTSAPGANSIQSIVSATEFVNPTAETYDFTLKSGSQLIGAGSTGNNIGYDQTTGASSGTTVAATGVSAATAVGNVTFTESGSVGVTGVSTPTAVGSVTASSSASVTITGVSAPTAVGSVSASKSGSVPVTGVSASTAVGNVSTTSALVVSVTGVSASTAVGNVTFTESGSIGVTGVSAQTNVGNVGIINNLSVAATGVSASTAVGNVSISVEGSISVTGVSAQTNIGNVSINKSGSVSVSGVSVSTAVGNVSMPSSAPAQFETLTIDLETSVTLKKDNNIVLKSETNIDLD